MRNSIQAKLFLLCSVLVFITSISISIPFFTISKQDKEADSQLRIKVAFEIIRDDIENRIKESSSKIQEFLLQASAIRWELKWYNTNKEKRSFFSNPTYSSYINGIGKEFVRFSHFIFADKLLLYTEDNRLLVSYDLTGDTKKLSAYVVTQNGQNSFLPIEDYSRLLIKKKLLPTVALPANLNATFKGQIPIKPTAEHFYDGNRLGIRLVAPVFHKEKRVGLLITESSYTQNMTERYARLSKTQVDFFGETKWMLGTLPAQSKTGLEYLNRSSSPIHLLDTNAAIPISSIRLDSKGYYQGYCILTDSTGNYVGTITSSISQASEKAEIEKILKTIIIITLLTIMISFALTVISSLKTISFIQNLTKSTTEIVQGNLEKPIDTDREDELGVLANSFSKMRLSIQRQIADLKKEIQGHKQTSGELSTLRNYLISIINSMPSALIGVNEISIITQWNTEAEQLTGITLNQAIGHKLDKVLPRLSEKFYSVQLAIKTEEKQEFLRQSYLYNGKQYYEDIIIYPLISGETKGAVIRIDDITERIQMETIMIQAEKMGSVAGLAAGMAHEINNPLAVISQGLRNIQRRIDPTSTKNIEAAREYGVDPNAMYKLLEGRKVLDFIDGGKEAVNRAAKIIKNMLMFSRKSDSELKKVDILSLIDHTIELGTTDYDISKKYDFKFVDIIKEYASDEIMVYCCPSEIEQVLLNLFKNAIQAMEELDIEKRKAQFHIRAKRELEYVRIEFEDNGPGIPAEARQRIFEPFFTTKAVGVGTGLGLSISYMIITQNHNGTFEVESELDKGTKFVISLPIT